MSLNLAVSPMPNGAKSQRMHVGKKKGKDPFSRQGAHRPPKARCDMSIAVAVWEWLRSRRTGDGRALFLI